MFEVGKKVICIKNHSKSLVVKGQVFELLAIKKSPCKCQSAWLDIGATTKDSDITCGACEATDATGGVHWFGSKLFAPYDDSLSELTAEHILEEDLVHIS